MDLSWLLIVKLCDIFYENDALEMSCFVCLLTFKSGFMAQRSGLRIQEEGYQSFSVDKDIDPLRQSQCATLTSNICEFQIGPEIEP